MRKLKIPEYDLELDKVIENIKKQKAKLILLQFPDGLKPYATDVVDYLEERLAPKGVPPKSEVGGKFLIWFGTCFGACDLPVGLENLKIDLIVQFGHNGVMPEY